MIKNKAITNEKLSEVCYLCILVNNQTDYCIFLNLSGHVNQISYRICESKTNYQRYIVDEEFYFDYDSPAKMNMKLDKLISLLADMLRTNRIDYDQLKTARNHKTYQVFKQRY